MTRLSGQTGSEQEPNRPADVAESVPGYRDLARIGHGGFSVVYRAVQESFERAVALKVLNVGPDEDNRRRFLREVRLASRLSGHPHVVTVLDTGTTASGRPYLAMDLYDGGSVKDRLRRSGPLTPAETAVVGAKIAEALAAAHSLGVLHRDVTPNNILISRFGEPALADFGVSCLLDSSSSASVLDAFSPQHAAPELISRGVPTTSSDIYALGSTLYQLLTGRSAFGGDSRDVRSIMFRVVSEPAPRPQCPELPELADAIVRAMAKEPGERFADAAEFARTLRALVPDDAPTTLLMSDTMATSAVAPVGGRAAAAATNTVTGTGGDATPRRPKYGRESVMVTRTGTGTDTDTDTGEFVLEPDTSLNGSPRGADHTMLRPERADPDSRPAVAVSKRGERRVERRPDRRVESGRIEHNGENRAESRGRRARKPLILVALLALIGTAAWTIVALQGSSNGTNAAASTHHSAVTVAAYAAPTRTPAKPKPSATPTHKHSAPAVPAVVTTPAGAATSAAPSASATNTNTSGGLLNLGAYHRLQNAQSGSCLTQSGGSAGQTACSSSQSEGWQSQLSLSRLLSGGAYQLVNEQSGSCLAAGSNGQVIAQTCDGGSAQVWSMVSGPGSDKEYQNVGDGTCLQASGGAVSLGSCSTSSDADLWHDDGSV